MILYKYRNIDKHSLKIISDGELYFSEPEDFNDPFDCKVHLRMDGTEEQWTKYLLSLLKNRRSDLSPAKRLKEARKLYNSRGRRELDPKSFLVDKYNIGIFCLSEDPSNILMWSHYASNHEGICIGFQADDNNPFFGRALEVEYVKDFPQTSIFDSAFERLKATVFTKSIDWSYEKEWRIIDHEGGPGVKRFKTKFINEILFGVKVDPAKKQQVIDLISSNNLAIDLFQARIKDSEFSLEMEKI